MSELWQESKEWKGVPVAAQYKESSKGTPYLEVCFEVESHKKFVKLWLTEKSMDRTMKLLADLGFNNDFKNPVMQAKGPFDLECKHEEWNGKVYESWTFWGVRQAAPIAASKAAELSARYKSVAGVVPKPATPMPTPAPSRAPAVPLVPTAPTVPPPPVPPASDAICTEEAAWAYFCAKIPNEELRTQDWLGAVKSIQPKTPEDWQRVAKLADIPF